MKHYETMFIIKPTLVEEEIKAKIDFFKDIITKNRAAFDKLVERLLEKEVVDAAEIDDILGLKPAAKEDALPQPAAEEPAKEEPKAPKAPQPEAQQAELF